MLQYKVVRTHKFPCMGAYYMTCARTTLLPTTTSAVTLRSVYLLCRRTLADTSRYSAGRSLIVLCQPGSPDSGQEPWPRLTRGSLHDSNPSSKWEDGSASIADVKAPNVQVGDCALTSTVMERRAGDVTRPRIWTHWSSRPAWTVRLFSAGNVFTVATDDRQSSASGSPRVGDRNSR